MINAKFLNKDIIEENKLKKSIEIHYDNLRRKAKKKIEDLIQDDRFFEDFRYLSIDVTLIEILSKENMKEEFFLLPNDSVTSESTKLEDIKIFIPIFYREGVMTFCEWSLKKINKYEFLHNVDTKRGLSGSSVFLDKTTKVIGIDKYIEMDKVVLYDENISENNTEDKSKNLKTGCFFFQLLIYLKRFIKKECMVMMYMKAILLMIKEKEMENRLMGMVDIILANG